MERGPHVLGLNRLFISTVLVGLSSHCGFATEPIVDRQAQTQVHRPASVDAGHVSQVVVVPPALPPDAGNTSSDPIVTIASELLDAGPDPNLCPPPVCAEASSCEASCQAGCDCEVPCAGLDDCTASCGAEGDCTFDCSEIAGECVVTCGAGSSCEVDCSAANDCFLTCEDGASCFFGCNDTDDCEPTCAAGSTCEAECFGADNCDRVECAEGASCLLHCGDNNDCEFAECPAGETECDAGIRVCGRPCP